MATEAQPEPQPPMGQVSVTSRVTSSTGTNPSAAVFAREKVLGISFFHQQGNSTSRQVGQLI